MSGQKAAKRGRRPKATDPYELAAILEYARLHDDAKAAEKFGISARTIRRHRKAMQEGQAPETAKLVLEQRKAIATRSADLICDTVDQLLIELQSRKAKLSNGELIEAVEKVGGLRISRDALTDHGSNAQPANADQPHPDAEADGGEAPEGTSGAAGGTGNGLGQTHH